MRTEAGKYDGGDVAIINRLSTKDMLQLALISDCPDDTDGGLIEMRAENILAGFKGWWGSKADNFVGLFE